MAVLKDYKCPEHGYFESFEAKCPHGCEEVMVVFLQAFSMKSDRTKQADETLKGLASDFQMTDIKSTREGEHQSGYHTRNNAKEEPREPRPGDSVIWGGGGGMSMQSILGGRFKPVADETVGVAPKSLGNLTGPRTASYIQDHENLKISR